LVAEVARASLLACVSIVAAYMAFLLDPVRSAKETGAKASAS